MRRLLPLVSLLYVGAAAGACGPPEPPTPAHLDVITRAASPSGRHTATAYTLSAGGAAGYVLYRVTLGAPIQDQTAVGPSDVAQLRHANPLTIAWADDSTLLVRHDPGAGIDTVAARRGDVRIVLQAGGGAIRP